MKILNSFCFWAILLTLNSGLVVAGSIANATTAPQNTDENFCSSVLVAEVEETKLVNHYTDGWQSEPHKYMLFEAVALVDDVEVGKVSLRNATNRFELRGSYNLEPVNEEAGFSQESYGYPYAYSTRRVFHDARELPGEKAEYTLAATVTPNRRTINVLRKKSKAQIEPDKLIENSSSVTTITLPNHIAGVIHQVRIVTSNFSKAFVEFSVYDDDSKATKIVTVGLVLSPDTNLFKGESLVVQENPALDDYITFPFKNLFDKDNTPAELLHVLHDVWSVVHPSRFMDFKKHDLLKDQFLSLLPNKKFYDAIKSILASDEKLIWRNIRPILSIVLFLPKGHEFLIGPVDGAGRTLFEKLAKLNLENEAYIGQYGPYAYGNFTNFSREQKAIENFGEYQRAMRLLAGLMDKP